MRILIVEDDLEIASLISMHVKKEGMTPFVAHNGSEAYQAIQNEAPSLILLDIMLPDSSGLDICRKIKENSKYKQIPIIIISALGDESDIVNGLEIGADDYVAKPFSPKVLMARAKAALRGSEIAEEESLSFCNGSVTLNSNSRSMIIDFRDIDLTTSEYEIFYYLARRPGFVRTRDQISKALHGDNSISNNRSIDVHITSLRKKLSPFEHLLKTIRGIGYKLNDSSDSL